MVPNMTEILTPPNTNISSSPKRKALFTKTQNHDNTAETPPLPKKPTSFLSKLPLPKENKQLVN
jgi:hypothetical protein